MSLAVLATLLSTMTHATSPTDAEFAAAWPTAAPWYVYLHGSVGGAPLPARFRPLAGSASVVDAPVDASLSDLLARLHHAFGSNDGIPSERARQSEREVLLRNSNALVRAKLRLPMGQESPGFVYADMGAADSALRWQGLVGIGVGYGVNVLGGWRHVTYYFSPGRGFDSLEFDGPFFGATRAW